MMSPLLRLLAHDCGPPLRAIVDGMESVTEAILAARIATDPVMAELLHELARSAKRLDSVARIFAAGGNEGEGACSVEGAARDGELLARLCAAFGNVGIRHAEDDGLCVAVERAELILVFATLFRNSVEAMPDGGGITVSSEVEDEHILCYVTDSGRGVPAEVMQSGRLFDGASSKRGHVGVGLRESRRLLESRGGGLYLVTTDSRGTTVGLRIPVARRVIL